MKYYCCCYYYKMMMIIIIQLVDGFEKTRETCGLKKKRGKTGGGFFWARHA